MIYELLKPGKESAVTSADLMKLTGVTDQREIRRLVSCEREAGRVILSGVEGYYLPNSVEEVKQFIRLNHKRACSIESVLKSAREYVQLHSCPDQLLLDGFGQNQYMDWGIES